MQDFVVDDEKPRIFAFDEASNIFHTKMFQKYKVPFAVIGIGIFFVPVAVLGGLLAGLGTYAAMERLKDGKPELYNWVLQNPGLVELISIVATAGAFGLTLGGVLIGLVANFTMSATLDYIAEKHGVVRNVGKFSLIATIRQFINYVAHGFKTIKAEFSSDKKQESKQPIAIEAESVVLT